MARMRGVRRAPDGLFRYNEMVDFAPDLDSQECFNEVLLALAMGGERAVRGFANATAQIIGDVLACECSKQGHDEAAELAMGGCMWALLTPRYSSRKQLIAFSANETLNEFYRWRSPGTRLETVARITLQPGYALHSTDWRPLWTLAEATPSEPEMPWVAELARRAVRRSVPAGTTLTDPRACEAAAKSVLAHCDVLDDSTALRAVAEEWCLFFDTVLVASSTVSAGSQAIRQELRDLINRIWQHTIVVDGSTDATTHSDERLFLDTDRTIRRTYTLAPAEGLTIRRAFFGVVTSAVELSGLNPFGRLVDGGSAIVSNHS